MPDGWQERRSDVGDCGMHIASRGFGQNQRCAAFSVNILFPLTSPTLRMHHFDMPRVKLALKAWTFCQVNSVL